MKYHLTTTETVEDLLGDAEGLCGFCAGSGEGQYEGTTCSHCKGSGSDWQGDINEDSEQADAVLAESDIYRCGYCVVEHNICNVCNHVGWVEGA